MKVELTVIDHLGLSMYTMLPPVISEIVANSWDGESDLVKITLPEGDIGESSEVTIEDNGTGMSYAELNKAYLLIGRDRRKEERRQDTPVLHRPLMGRKGIGKLSAFGVAKVVEVETCREHIMTSFRMDIDKIRMTPSGKFYHPEVLVADQKVKKKQGTVVRLKKLKRTKPIEISFVRRRIAARFSVMDKNFVVSLNDKPIGPEDRLLKEKMQYVWDIDDEKVRDDKEWKVSGWIGTAPDTLDEGEKGIVIMARGKLAQEPTFFDITGGPLYGFAYMTGELHAEFLDEENDLIATHRGSVVWESEEGIALREWAHKRLRGIAAEWAEKRRVEREKVIREEPKFQEWLGRLTGPEKKVADKVINVITKDEKLGEERRKELATFMMESFDYRVFHELADALGENPDDASLIDVFEEWGVIEAREILRIAEGRVRAIEEFERFVREDAREVPTIHQYFAEYPWILDPSWTIAYDETYYSELLRDNFLDEKLEEKNRRIDFVCIGAGDTVHVVEVKRPKHKVDWDDLNQLEKYVAFVRQRLGNVPGRSYSDAAGYIVAGEIKDAYEVDDKKKTLEKSRMYVKKYEDLLSMARKLHKEFEDKLKHFERKRQDRKQR